MLELETLTKLIIPFRYEVDVDRIIEVKQYPEFVYMKPSQKDRLKFESVLNRAVDPLSCDKLLFAFLKYIYGYFKDNNIRKDEPCFQLNILHDFEELETSNFRRVTGIGATIPLHVYFPSKSGLNSKETVDLVFIYSLSRLSA